MGLFRTVSEINGDFSRKSHNFPTPVYFTPPLTGFPLELGIGAGAGGQKARIIGPLGGDRSLTISSALWIQYTNVTDERTTGDSKDRAYGLRIASRGNYSTTRCSLREYAFFISPTR